MMQAELCESFRKLCGVAFSDKDMELHVIMPLRKEVEALKKGGKIDISQRGSGDAQCGNITAHVTLRGGVPWVVSSGHKVWQQYDGPAAQCCVPYNTGKRARDIAGAFVLLGDETSPTPK